MPSVLVAKEFAESAGTLLSLSPSKIGADIASHSSNDVPSAAKRSPLRDVFIPMRAQDHSAALKSWNEVEIH